jgi:hypothetical protein
MTDIDVIYQEETHIIYLHPVSTLYNGAISGSGTTDPSGSPEKKTWFTLVFVLLNLYLSM